MLDTLRKAAPKVNDRPTQLICMSIRKMLESRPEDALGSLVLAVLTVLTVLAVLIVLTVLTVLSVLAFLTVLTNLK